VTGRENRLDLVVLSLEGLDYAYHKNETMTVWRS
jgi:hypothetical protein